MRRWGITVVFLISSGCQRAAHLSVEKQLAWVDTADVGRMLWTSGRQKRYEFLEVCGMACFTPGIGYLTYSHCYPIARIHNVDRTYDVIESAEHHRLKTKAFQFAEAYNLAMVARLDSARERRCGDSERWDELWRAMADVGDSVPRHPYYTSVIAFGEPVLEQADFQLHVPDSVDLTPRLRAQLCELPPRFGIERPVRIRVTTGDINNNPREHASFRCERGRVAA